MEQKRYCISAYIIQKEGPFYEQQSGQHTLKYSSPWASTVKPDIKYVIATGKTIIGIKAALKCFDKSIEVSIYYSEIARVLKHILSYTDIDIENPDHYLLYNIPWEQFICRQSPPKVCPMFLHQKFNVINGSPSRKKINVHYKSTAEIKW